MRVMVTGAGGFIGAALVRHLLARGRLGTGDGAARSIEALLLVDRHEVAVANDTGIPVQTCRGDLSDPDFVASLAAQECDTIFHLAASLTLEAEQHPAQAYAINVAAVSGLIEHAVKPPRFIFASSIAVFGGILPEVVDDTLRAEPDTTYGTHKAMVELLLANDSRLGRVDGRALRLPIVVIRPGSPSPAVSDRVAAIAREPLSGRDVVCGLAPDTRLPVASVGAVARALVALHDIPASRLPHARAMNLPALTVSVAQMQASVQRYAAQRPIGAIRYVPDAALQAIVDSWPKGFVSRQASELGLAADASFDAIVDEYLASL